MTFKKQFWAEFIGGCYAIKIKGNETPHHVYNFRFICFVIVVNK